MPPVLRRLGWFVLLWAAGVACLTATALAIRWVLGTG
ncbi:DUF2474 family protein [Teichococcus oryzae]|jgi:hypothetical protein|uniref:DUF2474 family protein n=1 Tax=Teichococcus oryzae TaxID=1608942 RepID=A0A5B2TK25_9PROT|nr:DUF2474 family protein [Pseudoroseomonas oryzae]KAA2214811.1 DUF2474 family protein [Pseudoroseomonas oryzae]